MKRLYDYILEKETDKETQDRIKDIKFTIWKEPKVKVKWLEDDEDYQKIEYKYIDKEKGISIDFLLGNVKEEKTWKLWTGKIGAVTYDDDPYCDLKESKFSYAIVASLEKIKEIINNVENEPDNYVQFYVSI